MTFAQFLRILWARRGVIVVLTIISLVGTLTVAKLLPPRYEAKTRIMLDVVKPDPVTGEVIASQFAKAFVKTQTELIKDYRVAGKVVDAFGWERSETLRVKYNKRSSGDNRDFRRWLAQIVIDSTSAKLIEGSNILEITYTSTSADTARKAANALRQAYVDQTVAFRREDAGRNAMWFQQQAEKLRGQLALAEQSKAQFERDNGIILQDDNTDIEMTRLKALAAVAPAAPMVAAPAGGAAPVGNSQVAQIDAQIALLSKTLGPNHPDIQNLRNQRVALSVRSATGSTGGARVVVSGPSVGALMATQTRKVLEQRGKVGEAQRLAADVTVLREQFSTTASRSAQLQQEAQSIESGLTLLGDAVAPDEPVFPKTGLMTAASLALGLVGGIVAALAMEVFRRRVRGTEDLAATGVAVIGGMPAPMPGPERQSLFYWLGLDREWPTLSATAALKHSRKREA